MQLKEAVDQLLAHIVASPDRFRSIIFDEAEQAQERVRQLPSQFQA